MREGEVWNWCARVYVIIWREDGSFQRRSSQDGTLNFFSYFKKRIYREMKRKGYFRER